MSNWDLENGKRPRDDDDGRPFGRRGLLWFAHALREAFTRADEGHPQPTAVGDELDHLVAWYCKEPMDYLKWEPAEHYSGKGFSAGGWELDYKCINRSLKHARDAVRTAELKALDAARIHSLDDWLRGDIDGTLAFDGESGGTENLPENVVSALRVPAIWRRASWPKLCADCRESFKPLRRNMKRCPECIELRKTNPPQSKRRKRL